MNVGGVVGAIGFLAIAGYLVYAAVNFNSGGAAFGAFAAGLAALLCLGAISER